MGKKSAHQRAEVHEVGGEAAFHALANHADGVVGMQRLEVRAGDAEVRDALVLVENLVEQPRRVLDELQVGTVELGKRLLGSDQPELLEQVPVIHKSRARR